MSNEERNSENKLPLINQIISQSKFSDDQLLNKELFRNIEILDSENNQLKIVLKELREDLKEKDNTIDESHKIIKDYQNLEKLNNELVPENEINKNVV